MSAELSQLVSRLEAGSLAERARRTWARINGDDVISNEVRIRLEGQLEVVEQAVSALEQSRQLVSWNSAVGIGTALLGPLGAEVREALEHVERFAAEAGVANLLARYAASYRDVEAAIASGLELLMLDLPDASLVTRAHRLEAEGRVLWHGGETHTDRAVVTEQRVAITDRRGLRHNHQLDAIDRVRARQNPTNPAEWNLEFHLARSRDDVSIAWMPWGPWTALHKLGVTVEPWPLPGVVLLEP